MFPVASSVLLIALISCVSHFVCKRLSDRFLLANVVLLFTFLIVVHISILIAKFKNNKRII